MSSKINKKETPAISYDPLMPDYNKTPYAQKKAARAKEMIEKYGLPKKLERKPGK